MGGVAPGVLLCVCLRCVLGFCLRTRGFVGLVLVVTSVSCHWPSPDASFTPSEVGNMPPFIITLIAFFRYSIAVFFVCFSIVECSWSTCVLPPCFIVLTVSGVGNAVGINHMTLRFNKLLFLVHKTYVTIMIERWATIPSIGASCSAWQSSLWCLIHYCSCSWWRHQDVCSNHNVPWKAWYAYLSGFFCSCGTNLMLLKLVWSNYSTVAMAICYSYSKKRW